jgi:hypothetical protein
MALLGNTHHNTQAKARVSISKALLIPPEVPNLGERLPRLGPFRVCLTSEHRCKRFRQARAAKPPDGQLAYVRDLNCDGIPKSAPCFQRVPPVLRE